VIAEAIAFLLKSRNAIVSVSQLKEMVIVNQNYKITVEDLRKLASMFWSSELSKQEVELSIIPKLLENQDQFIAILSISVSSLDGFFQIVQY